MKPIKLRRKRENDFLKFYRVIRYYYKAKFGLSLADFDMLLFLFSEGYFGKDKFEEFDNLLSWDVNRFNRLLQLGWIEVFRKRYGNRKTLYIISYKATRLITEMYNKLNGDIMPTSPSYNPMFKSKVSFTDKVYRNMIIKMNEATRQQQHQSPEE